MTSFKQNASLKTEKGCESYTTLHVRSTKRTCTEEAIFYAGESCQHPDLQLQQWGNAKDDVRNA